MSENEDLVDVENPPQFGALNFKNKKGAGHFYKDSNKYGDDDY